MTRLAALASILILSTGCSLMPTTKPIEVVTVSEPAPLYHPPLPLEVQLVDIQWRVLTPEIMDEYLAALEEGSAPAQAYYALTTQGYENLSMNTAEQKRYIKDVLAIIKYYRSLDDEDKEDENQKKD
tara:strand:- start:1873 stop:2253 length:381 start_codon:yes stop_codon:yes gene_type:complete